MICLGVDWGERGEFVREDMATFDCFVRRDP